MPIHTLNKNHISEIVMLQQQTPSRNWSPSETEDMLSTNWVKGFGVFHDDVLIGIFFVKTIAQEAEILELAINQNYRKKGFAQRLWQHVKEHFPNTDFFLEVSEHNTPAIKFYQKMGFKQIHSRKNYYGPGDDALIYTIRPDRK